MIAYLTREQILQLHEQGILRFGGSSGIRDQGLVESALAQPRMTFQGVELYPTLAEKAAALGFSFVSNHAFIDGNKRIGFAAMDTFLRMNGYQITGSTDELEQTILALASGAFSREAFTAWVAAHIVPRSVPSPAIS